MARKVLTVGGMREGTNGVENRTRATPPPPPPARGKDRFSETMWFKLGEVDDWREHESVSDFDKPRELAVRYGAATAGLSPDDRGLYSLGASRARPAKSKTRDYLRSSIPRSAAPRRVLFVLATAACVVGVTQYSKTSHAFERLWHEVASPLVIPDATSVKPNTAGAPEVIDEPSSATDAALDRTSAAIHERASVPVANALPSAPLVAASDESATESQHGLHARPGARRGPRFRKRTKRHAASKRSGHRVSRKRRAVRRAKSKRAGKQRRRPVRRQRARRR